MAPGLKMRVNVSAFTGSTHIGKFLLITDEGAFVQELAAKARAALLRCGARGELVRLENAQGAHLPEEELVGDVLRDGEDVTAQLRLPEQAEVERALAAEAGSLEALMGLPEPRPQRGEEPLADYEPTQGPAMAFEADLLGDGGRTLTFGSPTAGEPMAMTEAARSPVFFGGPRAHGPGDWQVDDLTPRLREFVATRFLEVHGSMAEPGNTFITVTMRPREPEGALEVRYSIARIDVIEFERLVSRKVQEIRARLEFFRACQDALNSLMEQGLSQDDYIPNLLPYRYRAEEQFDSLMKDADASSAGQVEGSRPVVVLDTSGVVGEVLTFVRAALKKMIYSFLVTKSKFNFIKFASNGGPVAFDGEMATPAVHRLREAEEFLDGLRPLRSAGPAGGGPDVVEALRVALLAPEADSVYLVTSGFSRRLDADRILSEVRVTNARNLPVHVIGIECGMKAELDLRRLADENGGTFREKRYDGPLTFPAAERKRPPLWQSSEMQQVMTIGGQADILSIMLQEEEGQVESWLEEQRCANQLLLVTATQHPVPEAPPAPRADDGPRLQDHIEAAHRGRAPPPQARGRSASQSRAAVEVRRPSVANPWPAFAPITGVVKVSQLKKALDATAKAPVPPAHAAPPRRPPSARRRPTSGSPAHRRR